MDMLKRALLALLILIMPSAAVAQSVAPGNAAYATLRQAPIESLKQTNARRAYMTDLRGDAARARSLAMARAAYDDSTASATLENWANQTAWTGANQQVSGGALFNNGGTAANAGINRPWALGTTGVGRAVALVNIVNSGSGRVLIGLSKDAAGAAPAANNVNVVGLSFGPGSAASSNLGTDTSILNASQTAPIDGLHVVTITVDEQWISVVAVRAGAPVVNGTTAITEYRAKFSRASFGSISNIYVQNTSSLNLTGSSVGLLGWRNAIATLPTSFGIEGVGRSVFVTQRPVKRHNSNTIDQATIKIETPVGYDSRFQYPAIVFFHGNGSNEDQLTDNGFQAPSVVALLNDGYVVISAAGPNLFSWGVQSSLDAYVAAVKIARDRFNIGVIGFYANSMGGIESLLALADGRIPGVVAWAGTVPTYSLADNYANSLFTGVIGTAYGIPGRAYAVATLGYDPALMRPDAFRGVPMLILAPDDDAAVVQANNAFALAAAVAPYSPEVVAPRGLSGGHSLNLANTQSAFSSNGAGGGNILGLQGTTITFSDVIAAFFRKYLQP